MANTLTRRIFKKAENNIMTIDTPDLQPGDVITYNDHTAVVKYRYWSMKTKNMISLELDTGERVELPYS